ncbi:hypothetical protein [Nostoc sp. TCL240-02]|uniref:hypothetical protein n=1 Tax=Nostoc sp. TCL240-02 TaxID=2572090 RepID=UPI00157F989D|nr:hypothetical protein [Nostoc sp. TCL240-02]QKQ75958.1 hypothetical protein FBB35_24055 [Nostoc sp. TCL240-02]
MISIPLPRQKSLDNLTPGRVAQAMGGVLVLIPPPTHSPKPRQRKNRYPIVEKTATVPRKEPSVGVSDFCR